MLCGGYAYYPSHTKNQSWDRSALAEKPQWIPFFLICTYLIKSCKKKQNKRWQVIGNVLGTVSRTWMLIVYINTQYHNTNSRSNENESSILIYTNNVECMCTGFIYPPNDSIAIRHNLYGLGFGYCCFLHLLLFFFELCVEMFQIDEQWRRFVQIWRLKSNYWQSNWTGTYIVHRTRETGTTKFHKFIFAIHNDNDTSRFEFALQKSVRVRSDKLLYFCEVSNQTVSCLL